MKFMSANRLAPDGTPRFAASYLGLFCLPMSYKKGHQAFMGYTVQLGFTEENIMVFLVLLFKTQVVGIYLNSLNDADLIVI